MNTSEKRKDQICEGVRRAVLWGESRADIFQMMTLNGIIGDEADAVYREAMDERISILRGKGWRILLKGALFLGIGATIFLLIRFGELRLNRGTFVTCGLTTLYGLWVAGDGLARILLAGSESGSVTED